jgi:hypothetical protein
MKAVEAKEALLAAKKAWDNGQGVWPQMTMLERIEVVEKVVASLK